MEKSVLPGWEKDDQGRLWPQGLAEHLRLQGLTVDDIALKDARKSRGSGSRAGLSFSESRAGVNYASLECFGNACDLLQAADGADWLAGDRAGASCTQEHR